MHANKIYQTNSSIPLNHLVLDHLLYQPVAGKTWVFNCSSNCVSTEVSMPQEKQKNLGDMVVMKWISRKWPQ